MSGEAMWSEACSQRTRRGPTHEGREADAKQMKQTTGRMMKSQPRCGLSAHVLHCAFPLQCRPTHRSRYDHADRVPRTLPVIAGWRSVDRVRSAGTGARPCRVRLESTPRARRRRWTAGGNRRRPKTSRRPRRAAGSLAQRGRSLHVQYLLTIWHREGCCGTSQRVEGRRFDGERCRVGSGRSARSEWSE